MRRHRLMGIAPGALEAAVHERQEEYRTVLDQLRSRLSAAEALLDELRGRKGRLIDDVRRLDSGVQHLLQAMDQMGQEAERPRQSLVERHRRAEQDLREGLAILERERDGWLELERQIAEGVMAAIQPYLDLTRLLPDLASEDDKSGQPDPGGGDLHG